MEQASVVLPSLDLAKALTYHALISSLPALPFPPFPSPFSISFLRQNLTKYPDWPQTHSNSPTPVSIMLALQIYFQTPTFF